MYFFNSKICCDKNERHKELFIETLLYDCVLIFLFRVERLGGSENGNMLMLNYIKYTKIEFKLLYRLAVSSCP